MRCQEVRTLVKSYYENKIEDYTKIKIHHHLATCKECREDFEIWERGEKWLQSSSSFSDSHAQASMTSSTSDLNRQVMARIQKEEKWANPSTKSSRSYSRRAKSVVTVVGLTLMLFFIVLLATTFIPQTEVTTEQSVAFDQRDESWEINKIILKEKITVSEGTTMNFNVVASLNDPLIYSLPIENRENPLSKYLLILIFGIFCVVMGMSWITRA